VIRLIDFSSTENRGTFSVSMASRIPIPRQNSQQKKPVKPVSQDPIQPEMPPAVDRPQYKRPTIADLRIAREEERVGTPVTPSPVYARPKLENLKEMHVNFTLEQKIEPDYRPHTVEEYRELQAMQDLGERGSLGPSLDDEWQRKQQARARVMQFGQKIAQENKSVIPKRNKPRSDVKKQLTKRDKMRQYAGNIPKPKISEKESDREPPRKRIPKPAPTEARYDMEAELCRHEHFVKRVETLMGLTSDYVCGNFSGRGSEENRR
jgi:hypothetical protein